MIKAVFFDIDGTLASFNTHQVPPSARESINRLRAKGIKVFIATGRRFQSINNLGDLEFDGYITLNGGYCLLGKEQVIYKQSIPHGDIQAILHYQETVRKFPCALVQENGIYMNEIDEQVRSVFEMLNFPSPPIRPFNEIADQTTYQLIAFFTQEQEREIMTVMPHSETTRWNPVFTDIVPKGINKSIGINKILEHYGFTIDQTMAFGDGGNDIAMLQHAGIGVAMGNADEKVKASADYVTETVDNDGIYQALIRYKLL
ncbi:Cof-type HAD-IIB family hydrolase [Parabacteroides sp. PF5-9]|uniref:Cof-type HAD-IIB family hydrolase n=1 Tax=Parabacteroides sp. PF5-9 TaxID=1742404 RepID=UPI0024748995|nr:Cof-type HAD-IIB family hydrolase [Parabacteroides sp. PF5-9]MDH6357873.1 Cof subfamily protein (haloacid dehalogenase superfamily) [Parabacteroides sp. PF5-9]